MHPRVLWFLVFYYFSIIFSFRLPEISGWLVELIKRGGCEHPPYTCLLITVPPMAGMWFHGVMGTYSGWNAMSGWNNSSPQSAPPGISGGNQNNVGQHNQYSNVQIGQAHNPTHSEAINHAPHKITNNSVQPQPETIKQYSQFGNANSSSDLQFVQTIQPKKVDNDKSKTEKENKL